MNVVQVITISSVTNDIPYTVWSTQYSCFSSKNSHCGTHSTFSVIFCSLFICLIPWRGLYAKEDISEATKIIVLLGCSEKNFTLRPAKLLHSC